MNKFFLGQGIGQPIHSSISENTRNSCASGKFRLKLQCRVPLFSARITVQILGS
jgi:hypothetical protein